ncbi:MAG TPA: hypothetical protein P5522_06295 [Spirochaetia bacterium]|nr:hypothetical protein [Spirochaetia bacterium]
MSLMTPIQTSRDNLTVFRGLNKTLTVAEGEFADMQNMTGDHFPVLSPRQKRLKCHTFTKYKGIYGKDKLIWVDGTDLYYDGVKVEGVMLEDSPKTFVGMGAYVLIFPDKYVFNTYAYQQALLAEPEEEEEPEPVDVSTYFSPMDATFTAEADVTFDMCDMDGNDITYTASTEPPAEPEAGQYWMDQSGERPSLKKYSAATQEWVSVSFSYVKLGCPGIGTNFRQFDGVTISGASDDQFNGDRIIQLVSEDWIVLQGSIESEYTQTGGGITIKRECPTLEYVTECNNRVWGCNSDMHEIYACRQGDPWNWRAYEDLSSASYAVTIGTDGRFTGAATFNGYPLFFKENCVHKILGSVPSNFAVSVAELQGVQHGSSRSLCVANNRLYYKAVNGVMAYDGGQAINVSGALGNVPYGAATGGKAGDKYYLSMKDASKNWHMFVLDTKTGMWHREDNTQAERFTNCLMDTFFVSGNNLWAITRGDVATAFDEVEEGYVPGEGGAAGTNAPLEWHAETGDILWLLPDRKHLEKMQLRAEIPSGGSLAVSIKYPGGAWTKVWEKLSASERDMFNIPITPRRCDHFRLKLSGTGDVKVYALSKTYAKGSDV